LPTKILTRKCFISASSISSSVTVTSSLFKLTFCCIYLVSFSLCPYVCLSAFLCFNLSVSLVCLSHTSFRHFKILSFIPLFLLLTYCLSVSLSVYLYVRPSILMSVYLQVCQSVYLYVSPPVLPSICQCCLSFNPSICLSLRLFVSLPACLPYPAHKLTYLPA
jgi:hypothetical protein